MKTIHKYKLESDNDRIQMPKGAEILCLQVQHNIPCIWALVDPEKPLIGRSFITMGTDWSIDNDKMSYIGTYQIAAGAFIWHVFETEE